MESTEISHLPHVPTYTQTLPLWKRRSLPKLLIQVHFQIAKDSPKCQQIYFERSASIFLAPTYRSLIEKKASKTVFLTFGFKTILNKRTTLILMIFNKKYLTNFLLSLHKLENI